MRRCLAVGTDGRRAFGCGRRIAKHRIGVAGRVSVMREARRVRQAGPRLGESCEGRAMEAQPAPRLQRLFDRQARELVTKRDRARSLFDQHSRAQTLHQCADVFTS